MNRLGDSQPEASKPGAKQPGDEAAVQPLPKAPPLPLQNRADRRQYFTSAATTAIASNGTVHRARSSSHCQVRRDSGTASGAAPIGEPEIPRARPISPVGRIAASDTDALSELGTPKSQPPSPPSAIQEAPAEEKNNALAATPTRLSSNREKKHGRHSHGSRWPDDSSRITLPGLRKPLRLPSGRYFIDSRTRTPSKSRENGRHIAYAAPEWSSSDVRGHFCPQKPAEEMVG